MSKQNVAVIFGSRSAEHDVSIITAIATIIKPLELSGKYNVIPVYISKDGQWFSDPKLSDITLYSSGKIKDYLESAKPLAIEFDGHLTLLKPGLKNNRTHIGVVFPATHGTYGEDGDLMGLLEMANVPYVGCNVPASALAMDKVLAKIVAGSDTTNKYEWFYADDFNKDKNKVLAKLQKLTYPLFVKPTHLGSSIAITRIENKEELVNAIELAAHYDDKIIVEEAVNNLIEVTVPLIGNHEITAANTEQPIQGEDFFDFETKYIRGGKNKAGNKGGGKRGAQGYSNIPAKISKDMQQKSIDLAKHVYTVLGCSGIARVDLLIDSKTDKIYFNEVNPLPGSLYVHNWRSVGISNVELVERLINLAFERAEENKKRETAFSTNFLKQF